MQVTFLDISRYNRKSNGWHDFHAIDTTRTVTHQLQWLSSYLVWVGVKFSNAKEEELLINDASQIGSKKFDFSIE